MESVVSLSDGEKAEHPPARGLDQMGTTAHAQDSVTGAPSTVTVLNNGLFSTSSSLDSVAGEIVSQLNKTTERILTEIANLTSPSTAITQNINITTPFSSADNSSGRPVDEPEVAQDSGIGTAEHVVIGAVCVVVFLAILAIVLRIVMPHLRKKSNNTIKPTVSSVALLTAPQSERKFSGLSAYTNFATDIASQSSGSGSSPGVDWSESDSSQTRTTYCSEEHQITMAGSYGNVRGSSHSLPVYLPPDNKSVKDGHKGDNSPHRSRRLNDELMSVISTKSLEPLKLEDRYRNRWDDEWDPYGSLPRSSLSHYSHPSESSMCEPAKFPTPSREQIQKIHGDKDKRYPSKGGPEIRKEKAVRVTTPKKK